MLLESFLPEAHQHYMDTNLKLSSSYRKYSPTVPSYLYDRPPQFVKHCLKSRFAAAEYREEDIVPWQGERKGVTRLTSLAIATAFVCLFDCFYFKSELSE